MFETPLGIAIFVLLCILAAAILIIAPIYAVAYILLVIHLKRTKKSKWKGVVPSDNAVQNAMYGEGFEWSLKNKQYKKDLHIVNEGINLYGEYYDFGYDKALIFISGRTESHVYGYYFSEPYPESGFNVLVIDQRAHGKSDGKYNTLGYEEHKDILCWAKFLHEEYGVKNIVLHGICIGSSCALMTLTSPNCPDYIGGMIAEGMYPNFSESFKNHMIELKKPIHPVLEMVDQWFKLITGHSMRVGNIDIIHKLKKPILMLHSREDAYSLPVMAQILYDKIPHENKKLAWFEYGKHSHLRPENKQKYDGEIKEFLSKYF
ncbi:MAG: alpha/beta fold hydrolase [Clostridia bacterium]|nr:alpha/beta fold hydrolase [Clostridia bacterium]